MSCNPTGVSWTDERKAQVYALACELDFIIFDDDAYFYLQFPPASGGEAPGLRGLGRSLLSMDTEGRVVRTDTFSKFLAPGFRLGFLCAPPLLHDKMARGTEGRPPVSQMASEGSRLNSCAGLTHTLPHYCLRSCERSRRASRERRTSQTCAVSLGPSFATLAVPYSRKLQTRVPKSNSDSLRRFCGRPHSWPFTAC